MREIDKLNVDHTDSALLRSCSQRVYNYFTFQTYAMSVVGVGYQETSYAH